MACAQGVQGLSCPRPSFGVPRGRAHAVSQMGSAELIVARAEGALELSGCAARSRGRRRRVREDFERPNGVPERVAGRRGRAHIGVGAQAYPGRRVFSARSWVRGRSVVLREVIAQGLRAQRGWGRDVSACCKSLSARALACGNALLVGKLIERNVCDRRAR